MNERFLFRGRRYDNGEWITGWITSQFKKFTEGKVLTYIKSNVFGGGEHLVNTKTVGQCTALKDKNGKPIFEGDILRVITGNGWSCPKGTKVYYEVVFTEFNKECATWAEYIGFMAKREEDNLDSIHYIVNSHGAEVIGNVYDNPELLQRSDEE